MVNVHRPQLKLTIKSAGALAAVLVGFGLWFIHAHTWWMFIGLVPVLLLCLHYRYKVPAGIWLIAVCSMIALIIACGLPIAKTVIKNIIDPPEWDFLSFWINGRAALLGKDFYDPRNFHAVAQFLTVSNDFKREILDVGFWYPPPSILLFAPLGLFNIHAASMIWYILNLSALGAAVFLLWRTFFIDQGRTGLIYACGLVLLVRSIFSTAQFGQTNYLLLLFLTLFWKDRVLSRGGIWLGLCVLIKPFMAILLVYALLRKHWRPLIAAVIFLIVLSIFTAKIYGPGIYLSYFVSNPMSKFPGSVYTEWINQSLSAVLARAAHLNPDEVSPIANPLYLLLSAIMACVAGIFSFRFAKKDDDWAIILLLSTALIIYPASLEHYTVLLIVPLFAIWAYRKEIRWELKLVIPLFVIVIGLIYFQNGHYSIWANLLIWLVAAEAGTALKKPAHIYDISIGQQ